MPPTEEGVVAIVTPALADIDLGLIRRRARGPRPPACCTGSPPVNNTIGIVLVAALAANIELPPPVAAITATLRSASSAASAGNLACWLSAKRYSITTLRPST